MGVNSTGSRADLNFNGGELSLEQMNLDRKEDFQGDAFDPFNFGNSAKKQEVVNVQLQAQNALITKSTTVGGQMWTPEVAKKKEEQQRAQVAQDVNELDDLDDLEEVADQSLPPGQAPVEFQRAEEDRRRRQAELDEQHRLRQ